MSIEIALRNAYYEDQKEFEKKQAGVTYWEDIFKAPYETAAEQVQAASAYDISGAYSAYKRNQLNLMTQQQLGEGFKESIADQLKASYEQQYSGIRQTEASKLLDIQSAYEKQLASQEERVAGIAKFYSDLEKSMYEFAGIEDLSLIEKGIDYANEANSGYGYYRLNPETGEYDQTEYGKSFMKDVIESGDYVQKNMYGKVILDENGKPISMGSFSKWLAENNPELYEQYIQNVDAVREMVGGYEYAEYEKDKNLKTFEDFLEDTNTKANELEQKENKSPYDAWHSPIQEAAAEYSKYLEENDPNVKLQKEKETAILEQAEKLNSKDISDMIANSDIPENLRDKLKDSFYSKYEEENGIVKKIKDDYWGNIYSINDEKYKIAKNDTRSEVDSETMKKLKAYEQAGLIKKGDVFKDSKGTYWRYNGKKSYDYLIKI